ncbi:helix-turn-helix transcriptional regulator [uncultured Dialister sp.]|uniref:helix-turn-helix domain-containing protein n=1 Tax=uncultured Dialister sp. TaxID=278064 RepID=UPI0025E15928|nr:helix-turn-helix transcriptional regulator [uncultured Dialister sp.]
MDRQMLKGKLREKGKTYRDLAALLHKSVTTVSNKMNGVSEFDCAEACLISQWLQLAPHESIDIFLTKNLHDMQEKEA